MAPDPVDALYDLPLSEFVAARNELAKRLSKSGDKAKAAEVKALAKPSTSAFALNQVVRKHRAEVDAFLRASDRLARAQLRAMSGAGNDADFRAAVAEQRDALERVLELAAPALEEAGQAARRPVLEKIARTLRAIVLEESQRSLLERGRLSAELADQGFDALTAALGSDGGEAAPPRLRVVPPPPPEKPEKPEKPKEPPDRAAEKLRAEREAAAAKKARQEEARNVLREKEKAVAAAREKVDSARTEMEAANQEVVDAKRILIGAERIAAQRKERFLERQETLHAAEAEAELARSALLAVE